MSDIDAHGVRRLDDDAGDVVSPEMKRLTQLRRAWPNWWFDYEPNRAKRWTAHRRLTEGWQGGHSTCVAADPDILEILLDRAVQVDAGIIGLAEGRRDT